MDVVNPIKEALAQRRTVVGMLSPIDAPALTEMLALAGSAFVMLDMEHGDVAVASLENHARAATLAGAVPMVRVPANDPKQILRALDRGMRGIMVPRVESAREARRAVAAMRYPPLGERGLATHTAAARWGTRPAGEHAAWANEDVLAILQIETAAAVDRVEEIAGVPGVDVVLIGPSDLSASMGYVGRPDHPEVQAAIERAIAGAQRVGTAAGIAVASPDDARRYVALGVRLLLISAVGTIMGALRAQLQAMAALA